MTMGSILIVDDNEDLRFSLSNAVKKEGYTVATAASGQSALDTLSTSIIDLVFLDIGLPDIHGIDLINDLRKKAPDVSIVMLTGMDSARSAVESLKAGASDYIVKPFDMLEFKSVMHRLMQSRITEKAALLQNHDDGLDSLICSCEQMRSVKTAIRTASEVESPVLVTGETGTGKEVVARAVHHGKTKRRGVFVKVDCGTLSANLIESELFGYDQGAFTDARSDKKGLVEVANGGTLFLDEIGSLPLELQPKMLRLIEESTFRKVGGLKDIKVNVRIIAATNSNIEQDIRSGSFREDLFYRLNVIPIHLPPLKDRGNDILFLADYFLYRFNSEMKKNIQGFTQEATKALLQYNWPGNIRELRNLIEREVIFSKDSRLSLTELQKDLEKSSSSEKEQLSSLAEMERAHIRHVLLKVGNNKSKAARILGISRTTLRGKLDSTTSQSTG